MLVKNLLHGTSRAKNAISGIKNLLSIQNVSETITEAGKIFKSVISSASGKKIDGTYKEKMLIVLRWHSIHSRR